jgi:hypothetical protein
VPVELFANNAQTTLNGGITAVATSLVVTSAAPFPTPSSTANPPTQFRIRVEDAPAGSGLNLEFMTVTDASGATWTVARGQEGSTGAIHANGSAVTMVATAAALTGVPSNVSSEGTLATRPAASAVAPGFLYWANDDNGGTVYRSTGAAWHKLAPGVLETGGRELGSASLNSSNAATSAINTYTDVSGLSVAFTAGSRPVNVILGGSDMSGNTAGAILVYQAVRTDDGSTVCMFRLGGTNYPANMRMPLGTVIGRMSGLTPGNSYTVKGQVFTTAGTGTLLSGNTGGYGAFLQVVEV